jgi:subfamily B ATP-binding cassette protein MsbA
MARDLKAGDLLGRVWRDYVGPHGRLVLALIPIMAAVAGLATAYGYIVKTAIDGVEARDVGALTWAPIAVVVATAGRALAIWGQMILTQELAQRVLRDIQNAMFAKIVRADFARFALESSGQLVSRLTNDINVIAEGVIRTLQTVLKDVLTLIGAVALMLYLDWALALLVFALFAITGPVLARIAKRARRQTEEQQTTMGRLTGLLSEVLSSPRFVKTYSLEASQSERAAAGFQARHKVAMKLARNRANVDPLMEFVGGLALGMLLFAAGWRIAEGDASLGDLFGLITAFAVAAPSARAMGTLNTVLNEGLAALARVYALLDEEDSVVDAPNAEALQITDARIVFERVSFAYGAMQALADVSFTVAPGQTVAIVGGSGAGKSTVFNLIPRLYDPTGGRILVDGQDIRTVTLASLRRSIALVSQDVTLFDDTVQANIAFGRPEATFAEIETAAKAAAAHDFIAALPHGYDTRVGERGMNLSGGERQRVALARAFLRDAPILLLDEATSALDAASEAKIQDALARLSKGRTTLVIAHRLATVRDADWIIVMDRGGVVETGTHDTLTAANGVYATLAKLQFDR